MNDVRRIDEMTASSGQPNVESTDETFDWSQVRAIYRKLHHDFHLITTPFGIQLDAQLNGDLACLIAATDSIDRNLDEIEGDEDRNSFSDEIVARLVSENEKSVERNEANDERLPAELCMRVSALRDVIRRRAITEAFVDSVREIFRLSEAKRAALTSSSLVRYSIQESRETGRLPVLLLGDQSSSQFEAFFFRCCEAMPAVDTILDARSDFRTGQLQFRPGPWLYFNLFAAVVVRVPGLLWRFPARWTLFRYVFSFLREFCLGRA